MRWADVGNLLIIFLVLGANVMLVVAVGLADWWWRERERKRS